MLRKDITNNVLEQHKTAGNSNLKVKATIGELINCESNLLEMDKKIDKLQENKSWNKTSVKEQA
jgi:hypothetical protein